MARHVGDLEKTCLEKKYSVFFWREPFGEIVVGDLEKSFGDFGENRSAILEKTVRRFWRKPFGASFGILEKLIRRNHGRRFGEIVR